MVRNSKKIFICYIPGLDRRRITTETMPFVAQALAARPSAKLSTLPSAELLSSLVTGQRPDQHGIWQTRLRERRAASLSERIVDSLPEFLTVTAQLVRHRVFHDCEVPTMPPWRRRHLDFVRLKFFGHATTEDLCSRLNGAPSIFDAVGRGESRYRFTDRFADRHDILPRLDLGAVSLDMIQFHALDMLGHWQLSTSERLHHVLKETDEFVRRLHEMCEEAGVTFLLVSDHGQEPIRHTIDLKAQLEELDLPRSEYAYFLQPVAARFWFHSERARAAVTDRLSRSENGHFLSYQDLAPYNVAFEDGAYGESYFVPDPGYLLFPHDFHHPLANLYMGLTDSQQRDRLRCPIHVAYHGYLPTNDCEEGLLIIFDDNYSLEERRISLLDVAPSLLAMMNCDAPPQMVGQSKLGA